MPLAKTEKGRAALAVRGQLSTRERHIIILCDNKRNVDDFVKMMGIEVVADLLRLEDSGLIVTVTPDMQHVDFSNTGTAIFLEDQGKDLPPLPGRDG